MPDQITITIERDIDWLETDHLELEIDDEVQVDRITPWPGGHRYRGYGETTTESAYGQSTYLPYGDGYYGEGYYGQGGDWLEHETVRRRVAGNYRVRTRSVDALGNQSPWSDSRVYAHRPTPPAPTNLTLTDGVLTWNWSDPDG